MAAVTAIRIAGRVLIVLQAGMIAYCTYEVVDAYVTPYVSEWLTPDAFVPYYILTGLFIVLCIFLTTWVMRCKHRLAWLGLSAIALVTLLPYAALIHDAIRFGLH